MGKIPQGAKSSPTGRSFQDFMDKFRSIFLFPLWSIHFNFSLSSKEGGEVSQFRETFSPKSPNRPWIPETNHLTTCKQNLACYISYQTFLSERYVFSFLLI